MVSTQHKIQHGIIIHHITVPNLLTNSNLCKIENIQFISIEIHTIYLFILFLTYIKIVSAKI